MHICNSLFFVWIFCRSVGKCNVNNDLKLVEPFKAFELRFLYYNVNGMPQFATCNNKTKTKNKNILFHYPAIFLHTNFLTILYILRSARNFLQVMTNSSRIKFIVIPMTNFVLLQACIYAHEKSSPSLLWILI